MRESLAVRRPASGAVVLLARRSNSGSGTAKERHEANWDSVSPRPRNPVVVHSDTSARRLISLQSPRTGDACTPTDHLVGASRRRVPATVDPRVGR